MAIANINGPGSQCYGWDVTQFRTDEEKAVFDQEVQWYRNHPGAFYDDGLLFFVPEMNLAHWGYPDDSIMKQKFFFVHMPWEDGLLGMNWTPFYEKIKKEFNWRCFKVDSPIDPKKERYIFYKFGMMPEEPMKSTIAEASLVRGEPFHFNEDTVEQGGIVYRNRKVWEIVNWELAFNDNTKPFEESLNSYQIMI